MATFENIPVVQTVNAVYGPDSILGVAEYDGDTGDLFIKITNEQYKKFIAEDLKDGEPRQFFLSVMGIGRHRPEPRMA